MKPICVDQPAEFEAIRRDHNGAEVVVADVGVFTYLRKCGV